MPKLLERTEMPRPDDPELLDTLATCARDGLSRRATAAFLRMAEGTLDKWIELGRRELREFDAEQLSELGSHGLFVGVWESNYALFESEQVHYLNLGKRGEGKANGWQPAMAHLRSRNHEWIETVIVESHAQLDITHRLELGTALTAVLDMIVELESVDPPQQQNLLPESTKST